MPELTPLAKKIAGLNALRDAPNGEAVLPALQGGLADRSPHVVAKAAELVAELEVGGLVGDLLRAYQRTFVNPLKKDPGCIAKTAIATTLIRLDHEDVDAYRRGIKYEQFEPI
jgi:hypothetical protein